MVQEFRYLQLVEAFSPQPVDLVDTNAGHGPLYGHCGETYTVLAHLKEG